MERREDELDLVGAEKLAAAHRADRRQRPQRIAKVEEQGSAHHHVELPHRLGAEVVHVDVLQTNRRAP